MAQAAFTTTTSPVVAAPAQGKIDAERAFVSAEGYNAVTEDKRAASVVWTVSAEATDNTPIGVQLKDKNGDNIAYQWCGLAICTDVADPPTGPTAASTGLQVGQSTPTGVVIGAAIAKACLVVITNATGGLDLDFLATTTGSGRPGIVLNGEVHWCDDASIGTLGITHVA